MTVARAEVDYPSSDGKPMAESTLQYQWIVLIIENLTSMFHDDPNVFVAGDLFWYPVEGEPEIRRAPDALVALGRPRGHRPSYKQWEENEIAPQVVFEILSHSNNHLDVAEMEDFYEMHDVQEFYWYDPHNNRLRGWRRNGGVLVRIQQMNGWVSPLLKIRFELTDTLTIYRPNGERFRRLPEVTIELEQERQRAEQERQRAEQERQRAEHAEAELARLRALLAQKKPDANGSP